MERFIAYLRDTKSELSHISWPTQRQTVVYTVLVIVLSILTSLYLGFFDFLFGEALNLLILR
jgi:preprotein translocase SecE subunit